MYNMIDQVDRPGQEEFIWAMRSRTYNAEDDLWRERHGRSRNITPLIERSSVDMTLSRRSTGYSSKMDNNTKELASLLSDELIVDPNNYNERIYEAAIAIGTINGFEALWDKYRAIGKGGPLRMKQILNTYVGNIMQEAFVYNGDVLKYSGNSFVVMWKQGLRSMADCVHQAVDFAVNSVKNSANYESDSGVQIDVKFSISCGTVMFSAIGCPKASSFIIIGKPLVDIKEMISKIGGNEVIMNAVAWDQLNAIEYVAQIIDEEKELYLITDFSSAWRSIQEVDDKTDFFNTDLLNTSYTSIAQIAMRREILEIFELRPCIGDAVNMKIYNELKRYIFPPIIDAIESNEPIENLVEMRYLVIMVATISIEAQTYHDVIRHSDLFYRMINNIIEPYFGFINKLNFNDSELTYYASFGIRGRKHELESRNGLVAATKCFKSTQNLLYVNYCSVSVVTGLVFCGPVGHHLRKEYTMIGTNLVKARNLVAAFPNKVTCDRETFLQSKMEARHFVLQDFKQLQGTTEFGSVYEYLEFDTTNHLPKYILNKYPMLDREFEVNVFKSMLNKAITPKFTPDFARFKRLYEPSGLFIFGEARQGKTRLIEELLPLTPMDVPMFRLRLSSLDMSLPYQTIYYLFGVPLGIADNSTTSDREAKLISKLRKMPLHGLECLLNPVFCVNFHKTHIVASLRTPERQAILRNIIKHLCHVCFTKPWIIFIDGGEFIDAESWELLYTILETDSVLVVATIGCCSIKLPKNARDYLSRTKCKCLKLLPIDKLYHAALACQMMDCVGIPIELEKILNDKSQGNPGWMENFTLSLLHSGIIWLRKVSSFNDNLQKLVIPLRDHLTRKGPKPEPVPLKTHFTLHRAIILNREKWNVFSTIVDAEDMSREGDIEFFSEARVNPSSLPTINSPTRASAHSQLTSHLAGVDSGVSTTKSRRTYKSVGSASAMDSILTTDDARLKTIEVCLMAPGGVEMIASYDEEFLNSYYVTHIMDTLNSFELLFLKAASVIGDFFLREMLISVMSTADDRATAKACQRLFEVGVIGCAEGDFRRPLMNYAPLSCDHYKVFEEILVQCNCVGFLVIESCRDLPRYSNCGFMRFKNLEFREAAYNLLTGDQLNELHTKAMQYLEKRSKKCNSCGGGNFTKILGNNYQEGALAHRGKRMASLGAERTGRSSTSMLEDWDFLGHQSRASNSWTKISLTKRTTVIKKEKIKEDVGAVFRPFKKAGVTGDESQVVRTFDQYDFTCCECDKILRCFFFYVRKHYEVIGQYEKWMYATLEYSVLCTQDYNFALALKYLDNAWEILNGPYKELVRAGESWKYNIMKARILAEIGRARAELGHTRSAFVAYASALGNYGYTLPKIGSLRFKFMELKQLALFSFKSRRGIGSKYGYVAEFCDNMSSCLYLMTNMFITLELWDSAYVAAMWCLKKALQSEKNFVILINAFEKMIYITGRMKKYTVLNALEVMALDYCRRYRCSIDVNDLRSIAALYSSIFYTRVQRANYESALSIGVSLDTLTDMLHLRSLLVQLFPLFFEILLIRMEANDIYLALGTYEQVSAEYGDYLGDVWYYSLCVYFHLQTGYMYNYMNKCEEYYYTQSKRLHSLKEPDAERRYFVAIWLWYIRTENYDLADIWEQKLPLIWTIGTNESVNNLITTLMYIEGMILMVSFRMDRKIVFVIEKMYDKISSLILKMESHAAKVRIIGPRLYHLKAYFNMCKMNEYEGWTNLDKAIKLAKNTNNLYDAAWAEHSERAWKQNMPTVELHWWKDHASRDGMNYHEMESNIYKISFYTLELPLYL